jgi:hypothetical protein
MLSVDNDDQTAEPQFWPIERARLLPADSHSGTPTTWFIDAPQLDFETLKASPTLVGLLELLPDPEVVMLQGVGANQANSRAV